MAAGTAEYVALINADLVVEPNTLARLVEELDQPDVAIAAGAVRLYDNPQLLNSNGNVVHVLGLSWVGGLGRAGDPHRADRYRRRDGGLPADPADTLAAPRRLLRQVLRLPRGR